MQSERKESEVTQWFQLFATPWTVAYQAPPSKEFSRQVYWSGLPFPSPGDLANPGIEPGSPTLQADALPSEPPGKPWCIYAEHIMRNAGLDEAQARIKIAGRNISNLSYADDTVLMPEREEELKSLLMKVKEESEIAGLKLNIQKTKIMESGPITSWQIDGETVEIVTDFILGGSKVTADGDCSHKIKRHLLLGRKVMTNLDSILKSRDLTLPTKVHLVKAMVFSNSYVWM